MAEAIARDYEKDCQWFEERSDELKTKYAGSAIAIVNGKVIHADTNYIRFLEFLRNKNIDPSEICIEVFPDEDAAYIL